MPYLDRDGVRLYYDVHGPAHSTRHPLLLTHGYSASAEMWALNLPALSALRQVITWDIRGHGRSDSPGDPSLYSEAMSVQDMAALLDSTGVAEAIIGGLSLGGYLSLAFYLCHPERVAALVLCDTGPGYRRDEPRAQWNAMATGWADEFDGRGLDALAGGAEVRASHHRSSAGLALAARGILTQHDSRVIDSLPSITVPTLVLVGAEDKPFLNSSEMMAAKIPGATRVVVDGAGHAANIDQPEAFDRAVLDFVDEL
jgi:pimeloyl-ACP methyl ester carboxylesterase